LPGAGYDFALQLAENINNGDNFTQALANVDPGEVFLNGLVSSVFPGLGPEDLGLMKNLPGSFNDLGLKGLQNLLGLELNGLYNYLKKQNTPPTQPTKKQ
jgi:hypothetical protein